MPCLDENLIAAWVEGSLSEEDRRAAEAHVERCDTCRDLLDAVRLSLEPDAPPAERADPWVGAVLAETYRVLHPVGSGGMGKVYAAEHLRLGRKVAVKVLTGDLREHGEALDRFRREAQTCGALGNRQIVDVLDFNQAADSTPFLVMELLEGEDLGQRLTLDGAMAPAQAVVIARQICAALTAAHDEGILHRDLKPSNIFLCAGDSEPDGAPFIKVLDFGVAKARGSLATLTGSNEVLGTPHYMSPEMASARHEQLDARSDLFSLGCILYEMLCGKRAFEAEAIPAVLYRVVHEEPPAPHEVDPAIPRDLSLLVMRLLSKDPDGRPKDAREASLALTGEQAASTSSRRGWLPLALVGLVVLGGAGLWVARRGDPPPMRAPLTTPTPRDAAPPMVDAATAVDSAPRPPDHASRARVRKIPKRAVVKPDAGRRMPQKKMPTPPPDNDPLL